MISAKPLYARPKYASGHVLRNMDEIIAEGKNGIVLTTIYDLYGKDPVVLHKLAHSTATHSGTLLSISYSEAAEEADRTAARDLLDLRDEAKRYLNEQRNRRILESLKESIDSPLEEVHLKNLPPIKEDDISKFLRNNKDFGTQLRLNFKLR